ncbi:NOL10 protein, partial [Polypterus senegalus]
MLNVIYILRSEVNMSHDHFQQLVFLHCDRYVEFHSQHGFYYKTRIPKFGRDFSYHYPSCDLYFVGARVEGLPSVSALRFKDALHMAVGTSTGQILLYDLRANRPLIVKDHHYGLPIKTIQFQDNLDLVLSADSKIIKMWNKETALGPAPRWCAFLDSLTEELEENPETTVYDDYKFVTRKDLENLGLVHLIGSPLLRAYMHGFFMDIRLYHKVKTLVNPFAYEEYRKDKIRQKIEETRAQRVQIKKLPKVNKELAMKLIDDDEDQQMIRKKKGKNLPSILKDDRFKVMFENPDYQVDEASEEFRLLNPIVSKVNEKRKKKLRKMEQEAAMEEVDDEEPEGKPSDAETSDSSDDDKGWVEEVRKQRKLLYLEAQAKRKEQKKQDRETKLEPQFFEIKTGEEFRSFKDASRKQRLQKTTLEDRLKLDEKSGMLNVSDTTVGSKQLTFSLKKVKGLEAQPCRDLWPPPGGASCLDIPGAQHFRHTRKCWGEDDRGHPDGFRVRSRHFRHTGAWLRRNAGKQLEPIRVPI